MSLPSEYKLQRCLQMANVESDPEKTCAYKKKAVDHLLSSLFEKCKPIPGNEEIVVTGYVMSDGKGDWFNMLNTCKYLQKKFPERTIRLIAISGEQHRGQLTAPKVKALDLHYFKDAEISAPTILPQEIANGPELVEKVRGAAAVVFGPVNIHGLYSQLGTELDRTGIALFEYDATTNTDRLSGTKAFMGLDKAFSIGIFTRAMKNSYTWKDIHNERLQNLLFGAINPPDEAIHSYLQTHSIFLCYMGFMRALTFFLDAASFAHAHDPEKSVDICFPCKSSIEELKQFLPRKELQELGFGSITMIYYEDGTQKEVKRHLGDGKKALRIFDVGGLAPKDFRILMKLSSPLVGCTGDNSLAQALSYGKIPFYEVVGHKVPLRHNLLSIIEEKFGLHSSLYTYLVSGANIKERAAKVSAPTLPSEAEQLGDWIRNHFSANSAIQGLVNQRLLPGKDPALAQKVTTLKEDYLSGNISIEKLKEQLALDLKNLGLI